MAVAFVEFHVVLKEDGPSGFKTRFHVNYVLQGRATN